MIDRIIESIPFNTYLYYWNNLNTSLNHWGQVTHICARKLSIIGSDNGLSPDRRQAIIWTNARILSMGPLGTKLSEIWIAIHIFSLKKMHLKMSSGKWQPFCLGLNVLSDIIIKNPILRPYCRYIKMAIVFGDLGAGPCFTDAIWGCHKPFIRWQHIIHLLCSRRTRRMNHLVYTQYSGVTWVLCHTKSLLTRMFVRQRIQANNEVNSKTPHNWPLCRESNGDVYGYMLHVYSKTCINTLFYDHLHRNESLTAPQLPRLNS